MSTKVHTYGTKSIGGWRKTACNAYMAEGRGAVDATDDLTAVTCAGCRKAIMKQMRAAAFGDGLDR